MTYADLKTHYHQIIYAVGAQSDRHLGIPGEKLSGSYAATEFVAWYNGHPDYRDRPFDLSQEAVAVIGVGNVAIDVVRILASSYEELVKTDIADYALEALRQSKVKDIYLLGRRGPAQGAFTNPELRELGQLAEADVIVRPEDVILDPLSRAALDANPDSATERNLAVLVDYAQRQPTGKPKRVHMRFLVSPTEIIGTDHVEGLQIVHNELEQSSDGRLRAHPIGKFETLPVGLVFRSIGYQGIPLAGIPFDAKAGVIPNEKGRVIDPATGAPLPGEYVVGWIKRRANRHHRHEQAGFGRNRQHDGRRSAQTPAARSDHGHAPVDGGAAGGAQARLRNVCRLADPGQPGDRKRESRRPSSPEVHPDRGYDPGAEIRQTGQRRQLTQTM